MSGMRLTTHSLARNEANDIRSGAEASDSEIAHITRLLDRLKTKIGMGNNLTARKGMLASADGYKDSTKMTIIL